MTKRKRASSGKTSPDAGQPPPDAADDAAVKEDMAHVSPDVLAGSPDIFASKPAEAASSQQAAAATSSEAAPATSADVAAATSAEAAPAASEELPAVVSEPVESVPEPSEASTSLAPQASAIATTTATSDAEPMLAPPPPVQPAAPVTATPYGAHPRRWGSSAALGIVLVVVGLFALGVVLFGIDLTQYGWPLFVIIPGLTLLVVGFAGVGQGASIPGGMITMLGLVLAYQSGTGDWPSWAFAWSLIVPGGVGLGMYLQALRDRDSESLKRGRTLIFVGVMIFMIGFVLFESILGISNVDYGWFGKAALPLLLIVIGIILLARSIQRNRRA
jgi:hypothetical protein